MPLQLSTAVRNGMAGSIETTVGTAPTLDIYTGSTPANCAATATGTRIATGTLPTDWLGAAANGEVGRNGTWTVTGIAAAGAGSTAGYFRVMAGSTCHAQGSISATGGGGDAIMDNTSIANGQVVTVNAATITVGGA